MLKRILFVLFTTIGFLSAFAQDSIPAAVNWSFDARKQADGQYLLQLKAAIQPGWKLFSTTAKDDEPNTRVVLDSAIQLNAGTLTEKGTLQKKPEPLFDNAEIPFFENELVIELPLSGIANGSDIRGVINFMALKGEDVVGPEEVPFRFSVDATGTISTKEAGLKEVSGAAEGLKRTAIDLNNPVAPCGGTGLEESGEKGLLSIFVLGFLGGLIALFTPCVFPMIPLTVSFFTKKSQDRKKGIGNALLYGFFIFLIYVILSTPFHFLDSLNPEILNNISTNVWLNLVFFVIFVVFALSFFGLFEITLPSSFSNSVDHKSGIGGTIGIFFMALTLALVSFSCTGPILGSLLAGSLSSDGGAMQLTIGMAGFGLALALPFALFALFPNWLSAMPKSGGWLTTVKVVLGFLELALAIKFLSNADLVKHWGILPREVFFGIWILIGTALSLYLFGILRFKNEAPVRKLGPVRLIAAVFFSLFTIYLLPGVTNTKYANRALISGFPPPLTYSVYGHEAASGKGVEPQVVNDYEKALSLAREQNKPLLIDFTGWACVNCRKMEENVWTQPAVKELISQHFILVSLYVDDRQKLPEDQQFIFTNAQGEKKNIITVGDKFATMEVENFRNASQPLYVIISPEERLLNKPIGYTPNEKDYLDWLECGKKAADSSKY
ncbi:protein-disulfide reductase DsbD family protein [Flavihumibacter stibioxidans]|uniref:Cytochrome C biogenesis protein n=1 Tax=Flavihumibacter stibioxidans TaxID=1834163 RepID=A0ABR7MEH7_9BACT|nr:cytochrome c biogenesis protein CcdA [Flavihumibacter stibioxidans]MBC6492983.1 cytochrome C biogenesis protein [Flavihumibacter stibioxidans]